MLKLARMRQPNGKYTSKQFDKTINRTCRTFKCIEKAHVKYYCQGLKGNPHKKCAEKAKARANAQEW